MIVEMKRQNFNVFLTICNPNFGFLSNPISLSIFIGPWISTAGVDKDKDTFD
jgi:hypothetical protein